MTAPVVIIGCGASKRSSSAPARDLYTGNLYRARLDYADALGGPSFVLSGLHGLIPADRVIEPYEYDLRRARRVERLAWRDRAAGSICRCIDRRAPIVVLASGPYLEPLELCGGRTFIVPARGLALGESLAWFKRAREGAADGE